MFADTKKRYVSFEHRRRSLRGVGLVVLTAALVAAAPATAEAVPGDASTLTHSAGSGARGDAKLLAGSPRIAAIEALVPRRGRYAGRLIVWVRVDHAPATARALARKRPETIHTGHVVARVGKLSRFATQRLELDRTRLAHGYFLRFSKPATRAVAAGAGGRVRVALRVAQTLDLDSNRDREDRALATTTRNVPLARSATTIEPADGEYVSADNGDSIQVLNGAVTFYNFFAKPTLDGVCGGADHQYQGPINPRDGTFSINDTYLNRTETEGLQTTGYGQFSSNTALTFRGTIQLVGLDGDGVLCNALFKDTLSLSTPIITSPTP
jgi:hypothetical protein